MRHRRGSSLLEVLALIATTALMLGLSAGLIQVLLRVEKAGRADLVETSEISRLALTFRADVRSATAAHPADGTLELDGPAGPIARYQFEAGQVVRLRLEGDEVRARDDYRLPRHGLARLESVDRDGRTWVALIFASSPGHDDRLEAVLAADHRFEAEGQGG